MAGRALEHVEPEGALEQLRYLDSVYAMVRARGGVCIADEVQVGYGRLGRYFWGFEEQGVVPDVITVAKGMGNGHPLGAVITRREIADALEEEGYFFSSTGGSPVSSSATVKRWSLRPKRPRLFATVSSTSASSCSRPATI